MEMQTFVLIAGLVVLGLNLIAVGTAIYKLGRAVEKFENIGARQAAEITELKDSVKKIGELVTKIAVTNERQDGFAARLNRMDQRIDELARGDGFVLPLPAPTGPR